MNRRALPEPSVGAARTKQGLVAEALSSEILGGRYRVGDLLPSEPQLTQQFGVSRQTVRAALRSLQELGLVRSQQGVGTQVCETRLVSRYTHSLDSAEDLLQYATTTRVRVLGQEEVAVDAALAAQFGCKAGEHWWRIRTVRQDPSGRAVVACSEIHIPLAFGPVLKEIARTRQPIFALIEQRFHETITEIRQDITCISRISPQEAQLLDVPPGSPGMEITRRYLGRQGRVLEVARSVHPAEIFKYSMRVRLRHGSHS